MIIFVIFHRMTSPEKQAVLSADFQSTPVDSAHNRYPFCIVWCPLPLIGLFIPFIGHLGIADSKGIIYDFAGSYLIGKEFFAFGNPARYVQFPIHSVQQAREWDEAIAYGNAIYSERPHQICCDNCHSHVAACLNHLECSNSKSWNMVRLCFFVLTNGSFVNRMATLKTWLPFSSFVLIAILWSAGK
uniref:Uncharacterized protein AlNc14C364G11033 n=1 Tax=Albugo laibachii Nc14 TaxID=890382 RepID=F0WXU6_9STRA|nr:conserved hypothetical protein [Albugo laibachii Nc14]|eukprot:CCA26294.1 conserved hypothetical protein [Albugo laibachii Nc14]